MEYAMRSVFSLVAATCVIGPSLSGVEAEAVRKAFESGNAATVTRAAEQFLSLRSEAIASAIRFLEEKPWEARGKRGTDAGVILIDFLGDNRAVEAAPVLCKRIHWPDPKYTERSLPPRGLLFRAPEALQKIGRPAVQPILRALAEGSPDTMHRLLVTLSRIVGPDATRQKIRQLAHETGENANLARALKYLEGFPLPERAPIGAP